jgi:hypothetical protein
VTLDTVLHLSRVPLISIVVLRTRAFAAHGKRALAELDPPGLKM